MREDTMIALIMFSISATANLFLGIALFRSWKRNRSLNREINATFELEDRAAKMEQTIDALASQVDQLTNNQDFLNRVILKKNDVREIRELPRENTPH